MKIFYAYHGRQNTENFYSPGGYGVGTRIKWNNVNVGDLVYIIQKLKDSELFQFCGVYEIQGHYESDNINKDLRFRFRMSDISHLPSPINIDENECGNKLPLKESKHDWSNFMNHFCRQGASFNQELDPSVIRVLNEYLPDNGLNYQPIKGHEDFEAEVELELIEAQSLSGSDLTKKLNTSDKKPRKIYVKRIDYQRNQYVVAAVLKRANGICELCEKKAPFKRAKNGTGYLEIHHKVQLSQDGDDTVENAIALCPNCHRETHFGEKYAG